MKHVHIYLGKDERNMKEYKKPVVTVDVGLAEGVYAASGAGDAVTFSELSTIANWGSDNGQLKFTANLSGVNPSQLTLAITFNADITSLWGGGAGATVSGKTATLTWYSAPSSAELTVQVSSGLSTLKIEGYSYRNS